MENPSRSAPNHAAGSSGLPPLRVRQGGSWLALGITLLATVALYLVAEHFSVQQTQERFLYRAEQERSKILFRLEAHAQVLRGGAAFVEASDVVSRDEWMRYVSNLQLAKTLPGIQGIGFALMIRPQDKAAHEKAIRAQGFADYRIVPDGERSNTAASFIWNRRMIVTARPSVTTCFPTRSAELPWRGPGTAARPHCRVV